MKRGQKYREHLQVTAITADRNHFSFVFMSGSQTIAACITILSFVFWNHDIYYYLLYLPGFSYLYRYFNGREHFYTRSIHEIGTAVPGRKGNHGYTSEGIQCIIGSGRATGSVPLYRYWNGQEHFYTTNSNEIGVTTPGHVGHHGYRSEGIAGYCFPHKYPNTVPLYRYWNGIDHFYTTNWHEIGTNVIGHTG